MAPPPGARRLAAILHGDVVGYSRLMAGDERRTVDLLKDTRGLVTRCIQARQGRLVDAAGDNLLAEFPSVVECVHCALEIQEQLGERDALVEQGEPMRVRLGVHLGDVIAEGDVIYGAGVNIAARLQELADPGGVCVSGAVLEQVEERIDVEVESLGPRRFKNVPEPVPAHRIRRGKRGAQRASAEPSQLWLRPAIAVLPFEGFGPDAEEAHLADGLCEDLITLLSLAKFLPVIARNSSFGYRGRSVDLKQVGRELSAAYLVEGSVRRSRERLRITAQLVDATTGHHLWAQRYDCDRSDLFEVQDEITQRIAASITEQLSIAEPERVARMPRSSVGAWEVAQRAWRHASRRTREDNTVALGLFRQAIAMDGSFVWAYYGLTCTLAWRIFYQWAEDRVQTGLELLRTARACMRLDSNDPHALLAGSIGDAIAGRLDDAIRSAQRAVELSPSLAWGHYLLGFHQAASGDGEAALASIGRAIWLSPRDPHIWVYRSAQAFAHFVEGDYEAAIGRSREVLRLRPGFPASLAMLAASHARRGELEAARARVAELLRVDPGYTIAGARASVPGGHPETLARYFEGLAAAGLPRGEDATG